MEGSIFRSEPSMSEVDIVEGSGAAGRTVHDNAQFHGRFNIQKQTFHAGAQYHGRFGVRIKKFMKTKAVQTAETIHPAWLLENIRIPRS